MTVSVTLTASPASAGPGQVVTAVYSVAGNTAGPGTPVTLTGDIKVGGADFPFSQSFTEPGAAAAAVTYAAPACPGLTFSATGAPGAYIATIPASATSGQLTVTGSVTVGGTAYQATANLSVTGAVTPPPSSSQCYFGVWDTGSGYPADGVSFSWSGVQKFAAAPVRSATYYMAWLAPYPTGLGTLAKANGATLYLNLEPWNTWGGKANPTMADIAAGRYDTWLSGLGQAAKAGGHPVWFTWAHEMNGNGWYPWQQSGGVTPAQWIAAWEHVYTTVKTAAGGLASFVWCPNNADVGPVAPYWPGPAFCDVAAADMYLNTPSSSQTYAEFAKQTVDQIGRLDGIGSLAGQVWNAETGVEGTSGSRSARITQFVNDMRADGRIRGFAWWNEGSYLLQPAELSALTSAVDAWNAG